MQTTRFLCVIDTISALVSDRIGFLSKNAWFTSSLFCHMYTSSHLDPFTAATCQNKRVPRVSRERMLLITSIAILSQPQPVRINAQYMNILRVERAHASHWAHRHFPMRETKGVYVKRTSLSMHTACVNGAHSKRNHVKRFHSNRVQYIG